MHAHTKLWGVALMATAAASLALTGCGSSRQASVKAGSTHGVTVTSGTADDLVAIATAFITTFGTASICPVTVQPGSSMFATINQTGVEWAIARVQATSACHPTANGLPIPVAQYAPFDGQTNPLAIFEKPNGLSWQLNQEASDPFPCPPPGDEEPGPGVSAVRVCSFNGVTGPR